MSFKDLMARGYLTFECPLILDEPTNLRQLSEISSVINALRRFAEFLSEANIKFESAN